MRIFDKNLKSTNGFHRRLYIDIMSDNGLDLIVYLVLTLGAGAVGMIKSAREKKAKGTRPMPNVFEQLLGEEEEEPIVITQQPEIVNQEDIFQPFTPVDNELSQKMEKVKEQSINGFGNSDEERYAILEKRKLDRRVARYRSSGPLLKEEEETPAESQGNGSQKPYEFDIRQAVIASEILNRKY